MDSVSKQLIARANARHRLCAKTTGTPFPIHSELCASYERGLPSEVHVAQHGTPSKRKCHLPPERLASQWQPSSSPLFSPHLPGNATLQIAETETQRRCRTAYPCEQHTDGRHAHPPAVEPSDRKSSTTRRPPSIRRGRRLHSPTGAHPQRHLHTNIRYGCNSSRRTTPAHVSIPKKNRRYVHS